jgi:hypothetical protein
VAHLLGPVLPDHPLRALLLESPAVVIKLPCILVSLSVLSRIPEPIDPHA